MTDRPVIIVSGIPRSGTSMMMQILQAGGVKILSDESRKPDSDNPKGYFELEKVKQLTEDNSWLADARGKAVKIISRHLACLPKNLNYRVIFMLRNLDEILASQKIMLQNRNILEREKDEELRNMLRAHLIRVKRWLTSQKNFEVVFLNYREAFESKESFVNKVIRFLEIEQSDKKAMLESIDGALYRQRRTDLSAIEGN